MKIRKVFSIMNLMVLAGIGLVIFGIGSVLNQYLQDNSVVVLANSGGSGGDPNAFRPPLQELATRGPTLEAALSTGEAQAVVTAMPEPSGKEPDRLVIAAINLDAPVLAEHYKVITLNGEDYIQWRVPFRRAAGWQDTTAYLGEVGNTVLNGHHNEYGEVFKDLIKLKEGDVVEVYSGEKVYTYRVGMIMLLPEKYQSMEERIKSCRAEMLNHSFFKINPVISIFYRNK